MTDTVPMDSLDHAEQELAIVHRELTRVKAENDQLRTKLAAMQAHARRMAELAAGMVESHE